MEERNALNALSAFSMAVFAITCSLGRGKQENSKENESVHLESRRIEGRCKTSNGRNKSHENAVQAPERGTWGNSEAETSAFVQKEPSHADDNLTKATTLVGKYVIAIKNAYREDSFYKNVNEETVYHYPNYRVENG